MQIIVKIETDSKEPFDIIKNDIEQELSCCWNQFDKVEIFAQPEIIRCRDCIYHEEVEPGMVWCHNMAGSWVPEDWFCADGERREDE